MAPGAGRPATAGSACVLYMGFMTLPAYDRLGTTYTTTRREDPDLAHQIHAALGPGRTLVNVGAGAGAYEPRDRMVVAVEPSPVMIAQRPADAAVAVVAAAERLPFVDDSFDVAMALHTVHHWDDPAAGLAELRRVARRVVVVAGDAGVCDRLWPAADYFPGLRFGGRLEVQPAVIAENLGGAVEIRPLLIPIDCIDGFPEAFIARPEAYLNPAVRCNISAFRRLPEHQAAHGITRLRRDLASGAWDARYGHLRRLRYLDGGLRIVISDRG